MANRSDFNSILPRKLKRQLSLNATGDKAYDREIRKLLIAAHAHAVSVRYNNLRAKTNNEDSDE